MTLSTPALLFPAVSLLLLAYTNRFMATATLTRKLKERYLEKREPDLILQIRNLRRRIYLIRNMQMLGVFALFLCVLSMFMIYANVMWMARLMFGISLASLTVSMALSLREIQLSIAALTIELKEIEDDLNLEAGAGKRIWR